MRTQEIVEAYGKTHIYMIGMDDNPQPKIGRASCRERV